MKRMYLFLVLVISFSSCHQPVETKVQTDTSASRDSLNLQYERNLVKEFIARKNDTELRLRDWKKDLDLEKLGKVQDTSSFILGDGADTHKGSLVKNYRYNTIRLQFFGPPKSEDVWLQKMEITGNDWETARGIRVGDTETKLKELYPEASNEYSGDKGLYRYSSGDSVMEFTVRAGEILLIRIIYSIP